MSVCVAAKICMKILKENAEVIYSSSYKMVIHNEPPHLDLHCLPSSL